MQHTRPQACEPAAGAMAVVGEGAVAMRPAAFLFDFDGTLVDAEIATCQWIDLALQKHGYRWTLEMHKKVIGTSRFFPRRCLELLGATPERIEALMPQLPPRLTCPEWIEYTSARTTIKPGALRLLQALRMRRAKLALVTSRLQPSLDYMEANRSDIAALLASFHTVVTNSTLRPNGDAIKPKPDPEPYVIAAQRLGVLPEHCIAFEDSVTGIRAAKASGATTFAIPEAWASDDALLQQVSEVADFVLDSLLEFDAEQFLGPPPPLLMCCGNPTVDISCEVALHELEQFGLGPGSDASGCDEATKAAIVTYAAGKESTTVTPGGAALNVARVAVWHAKAGICSAFFGCVGRDAHSHVLRDAMREVGVISLLRESASLPTGVSASLVDAESRDRTLATVRGAAGALHASHLDDEDVAAAVSQTSLLYFTSFVVTTQPRRSCVVELVRRVSDKGARVAFNLSSSGVLGKCLDAVQSFLPYCSFVFGNVAELQAAHRLLDTSIPEQNASADEAALRLKEALADGGVLVITAGADPTMVACKGQPDIVRFPVPAADNIVDTNGAGDAFVGGFLAELVRSGPSIPIEACIAAGHACAQVVLQQVGCQLPRQSDPLHMREPVHEDGRSADAAV